MTRSDDGDKAEAPVHVERQSATLPLSFYCQQKEKGKKILNARLLKSVKSGASNSV